MCDVGATRLAAGTVYDQPAAHHDVTFHREVSADIFDSWCIGTGTKSNAVGDPSAPRVPVLVCELPIRRIAAGTGPENDEIVHGLSFRENEIETGNRFGEFLEKPGPRRSVHPLVVDGQ